MSFITKKKNVLFFSQLNLIRIQFHSAHVKKLLVVNSENLITNCCLLSLVVEGRLLKNPSNLSSIATASSILQILYYESVLVTGTEYVFCLLNYVIFSLLICTNELRASISYSCRLKNDTIF